MKYDEQILAASAKHPKPADRVFEYGTAGFRLKASLLDSVVFRVGLLATLRSKKLHGQTIGVMITASHNPAEDNGVKLVDPMGEMLESSWELYATQLANAPSDEAVVQIYNKLATDLKLKPEVEAEVVFARDTRFSGPSLVKALEDGLKATGAQYQDFGIFTTPQLHYVTRCLNTKNTTYSFGEPTEEGYYKKMADAFKVVMKYKKTRAFVTVDCANGVGGPKLRELVKHLQPASKGGVDINIINDDVAKTEALNLDCGADYVKVKQRAPPSLRAAPLDRCASLDGDADRLVYYTTDSTNRFILLDGDRIATLAASFLGDLARSAGLASSLQIGVVQTAYANGASTDYINKILSLPVICTPTGVKHLHHAAARFDIGVYFEANGHGTVVFSSSAIRTIRDTEPKSPAQASALDTLKACYNLINQAVGDALSDLLLVEAILAHKSWGLKEWENTYKDLPNRQLKVEVLDRTAFRTTDAERKLESPRGIQEQIDKEVGKYSEGRAFARASGTEDVVRVYAEAATRSEADELAGRIQSIVADFGGKEGVRT